LIRPTQSLGNLLKENECAYSVLDCRKLPIKRQYVGVLVRVYYFDWARGMLMFNHESQQWQSADIAINSTGPEIANMARQARPGSYRVRADGWICRRGCGSYYAWGRQ